MHKGKLLYRPEQTVWALIDNRVVKTFSVKYHTEFDNIIEVRIRKRRGSSMYIPASDTAPKRDALMKNL